MKILDVAFDDYVRCPHNMHNTNILRVSHDNQVGTSVMVDELEEDPVGVIARKMVTSPDGTKTTYISRYPWWMVKDVKYAPTVVSPPGAEKKK